VKFRPHLRAFLERASKQFELVVFTAATREYADRILDRIDPFRRTLNHRLYRDSCIVLEGGNFL
jgi:CTD small phosphatase-like protein 2